MELMTQEVVVVGNPVNPGAVTQWMLIQNEIIDENVSGGIYTPQLVQVSSPNQFKLLVLPEKIASWTSLGIPFHWEARFGRGTILTRSAPIRPVKRIRRGEHEPARGDHAQNAEERQDTTSNSWNHG